MKAKGNRTLVRWFLRPCTAAQEKEQDGVIDTCQTLEEMYSQNAIAGHADRSMCKGTKEKQ